MRRTVRQGLLVASLGATAALAAAVLGVVMLGPAPRGDTLAFSTVVLDRNDRLLRPYATPDGRWRIPVALADVDPRFAELLIAYEDKRFRQHPGADLFALGRAAGQLIRRGRIVSGGSTLTMQVARLLEPRRERSFAAKLLQIVRALQLERTLSKDAILALYLNLAPYGGNLEGIRAASLAYFGREPRRLTLGEMALLVALPQSPEARRPDRAVAAASAARDRVLDRMAEVLSVGDDEVMQAKRERVPDARRPMPALAPHAADRAIAGLPGRAVHRLTIERGVQHKLEDLARERAAAFGPDASVAILAIEHATGHILARVGSPAYGDERRAGQIDMTEAVRSPGSALKPFIYGLAFEDGILHPETLIEDRPIRFGAYVPENFDMTFQGTVTARKALQLSLNVPAVAVLEAVRPSRLRARLAQAGAALLLPQHEAAGLAVGLGGAGVRLSDLTMLYAALARLGDAIPVIERADAPSTIPSPRLLGEAAAWQVADILAGTPPPENAAGGRLAFKTGTSYGYRDAWALGFDGARTVGVWVGRPDGAPLPGLYGRTAAAPILFDVFARMGRGFSPLPPRPAGALAASSSKLPPPLRAFRPAGSQIAGAENTLRIMFPPDGARLDLGTQRGPLEPLVLKVSGGVAPLRLLANGVPVAQPSGRRTMFWEPDGPGFVRLTVTDATGTAASVVVRVW